MDNVVYLRDVCSALAQSNDSVIEKSESIRYHLEK